MRRHRARTIRSSAALACLLLLGSCSYTYELLATVINGRLAFVVDPTSRKTPTCINAIDVVAHDEARAREAPGDDPSLIGSGTFWSERVGFDCVDQFPILYGALLKGRPRLTDQQRGSVAAKPLRIGVIYDVIVVTGATGYGGGAFRILPDRRVVNVRPPRTSDSDT
ncbi:hypothetical protein [Sphingomonas sp.]|uniref:hypothetical protein n=1 Tax=Sphingomonas sp. TaxID=28214 RepID=UPI003D6C9A1A